MDLDSGKGTPLFSCRNSNTTNKMIYTKEKLIKALCEVETKDSPISNSSLFIDLGGTTTADDVIELRKGLENVLFSIAMAEEEGICNVGDEISAIAQMLKLLEFDYTQISL